MLKFSTITQRLRLAIFVYVFLFSSSVIFAQDTIPQSWQQEEQDRTSSYIETSKYLVNQVDKLDISADWFTSDLHSKIELDADLIGTDFGVVSRNSSRFYTIYNLSDSTLNIDNITSSNPQFAISDFTKNTDLEGNGSINFTVDFTPEMDGNQSATIVIWGTQANQNPYSFMVSGTGDIVVLPKEYLPFAATQIDESAVLLSWQAIQQIRSERFIIQRSVDKTNFENIDTIYVKPADNPLLIHKFIDKDPLSGDSYYRLRQIDKYGKNAHSISRLVTRDYPVVVPLTEKVEPVSPKSIAKSDKVGVQIFNSTGRLLYQNSAVKNELLPLKFDDFHFLKDEYYQIPTYKEK